MCQLASDQGVAGFVIQEAEGEEWSVKTVSLLVIPSNVIFSKYS